MTDEFKRSWRWLLAAALPVLAIASVVAARAGRIEAVDGARVRDAIAEPPRAVGISPDGTRLLLQSESARGFTLSIVEKEGLRTRATITTGKRPRQAVWSPDGQHVAYGVEHGRAECELRIWDVVAGTELRPRVPSTRIVTSPRWAPDGGHVAFVVEHAETRRLFSVKPREGGAAEELAPDLTSKAGLAWSPDGARIATVLRSDRSALTLLAGSSVRTRIPFGEGDELRDVSWGKDGKLLVTVRGRDDGAFVLAEADVSRATTRRLGRAPLAGDVSSPGYLPNDGALHYKLRHEDEQLLFICDREAASCKRLGETPSSFWRAGPTSRTIFVRDVAKVHEIDLVTGKSLVVYDPGGGGVPGERVDVASYDGLAIPLLVRRADRDVPRGAVIHVFSGDHESPSPWDRRTDLLHDEGIAIVNIYVRGKPGFGRALHDAKGDAARDVLAARDWVERVLHVPAARTVLMGQSAGATVAGAAAASSPRLAAIVLVSIPSEGDRPRSLDGPPRCALVFHGSDDEASPEAARAAVEQLLGRGATEPPCGAFHLLPGEAHEIERAASWAAIYAAILTALPKT